ncbi:hypothetical protein FACS18945_4910 [Bacteroidia bacterium]|nr:hypothetical protein FACS18945_4910 [Bacteroidia bacterium]
MGITMAVEEKVKPVCMAGVKEWLLGTDGGAFHYNIGETYYTLIRVAKNEDFDYFYDQRQFQFTTISFGDNFGYAGIYCKRDGKVYDWQRDIRELEAGGVVNGFGPATLESQLKEDVRGAVESAIGNDRANLRVTEVTDEREVKRLLEFQRHRALMLARNHYLGGDEEVDEDDGGGYVFTYECGYEPKTWTEDSLLDYILNPADYTSREVTAYLDSHQTLILADFLKGDMIAAEYAAIMANPQNHVHIVKKIMRAMRGLSAKTVNVTVRKGGVELTFKAEAYQFREDCGSSYSNYLIAAAYRRLFEQTFGRHTDYGPADITRITYARKVIFEAVR